MMQLTAMAMAECAMATSDLPGTALSARASQTRRAETSLSRVVLTLTISQQLSFAQSNTQTGLCVTSSAWSNS